MDNSVIRLKLSEYIAAKGLKASYIASEIGVSPSMVSHFLAGRKNFSGKNVAKLQKILG